MKLASRITLNLRTRELGRLKTDYGIHQMKNREALIAFLKEPARMEGIDIDEAVGDLRAPLAFVAARMGDYELFALLQTLGSRKELLYRGIGLYDTICGWSQALPFFEYLDDSGFDFGRETKWGTLPILPVVTSLALEEIKKAKDKRNNYAAMLEIYAFLRRKGADIDEGGPGKISPLMIASCADSLEVVKMLKADGADPMKRHFVTEIDKEVDCLEYYRHKTGLGEIVERSEMLAALAPA